MIMNLILLLRFKCRINKLIKNIILFSPHITFCLIIFEYLEDLSCYVDKPNPNYYFFVWNSLICCWVKALKRFLKILLSSCLLFGHIFFFFFDIQERFGTPPNQHHHTGPNPSVTKGGQSLTNEPPISTTLVLIQSNCF